jgi:hypothetical protein
VIRLVMKTNIVRSMHSLSALKFVFCAFACVRAHEATAKTALQGGGKAWVAYVADPRHAHDSWDFQTRRDAKLRSNATGTFSPSSVFLWGRSAGMVPSVRGCAMLGSLSDQVCECLRHAEDCVQQAALQTDPKLRQDFLIITACWLKLSYELSDRLADFSKSKST